MPKDTIALDGVIGEDKPKVQRRSKEEIMWMPHGSDRTPRRFSVRTGGGKLIEATLEPGKWQKVPPEIADMLDTKRQRMQRPVGAPDGDDLERQMIYGQARTKDGAKIPYSVAFRDRD